MTASRPASASTAAGSATGRPVEYPATTSTSPAEGAQSALEDAPGRRRRGRGAAGAALGRGEALEEGCGAAPLGHEIRDSPPGRERRAVARPTVATCPGELAGVAEPCEQRVTAFSEGRTSQAKEGGPARGGVECHAPVDGRGDRDHREGDGPRRPAPRAVRAALPDCSARRVTTTERPASGRCLVGEELAL